MQLDNRISLGNVISFGATLLTGIGMAAALFVWGGRLSERSDNVGRDIIQVQTSITGHESRIRTIEQSAARQDERLMLILDSLRKIETQLERQQNGYPQGNH